MGRDPLSWRQRNQEVEGHAQQWKSLPARPGGVYPQLGGRAGGGGGEVHRLAVHRHPPQAGRGGDEPGQLPLHGHRGQAPGDGRLGLREAELRPGRLPDPLTARRALVGDPPLCGPGLQPHLPGGAALCGPALSPNPPPWTTSARLRSDGKAGADDTFT